MYPPQRDASASPSPVTSMISCGITGKMMPKPIMLIMTVIKMKRSAFGPGFAAIARRPYP